MTDEEMMIEIEEDPSLLYELKKYPKVTEDDVYYAWVSLAENNVKSRQYDSAIMYCSKVINQNKESKCIHSWERCYCYILLAQVYSEKKLSLNVCLDMLRSAEVFFDDVEDDELGNFLYLEWHLTSSKAFYDIGNIALFESHAKIVYLWCLENECYEEHYFAAINNLIIAYYQQGKISKGKEIIIEALDYICSNDIQDTDMVRRVFLTWLLVGSSEYTEKKDICNKKYQNYLTRLQRIVDDTEDVDVKISSLLFQSHFDYYLGRTDLAKKKVTQAIQLEKDTSLSMNHLFDYVIDDIEIFKNIFSKDELKSILFQLVKTIPYRLKQTIQIKDETSILKILARFNKLSLYIVSFSINHIIVCSDFELFEVVANCKSLYSDVLFARKKVIRSNTQNQSIYNEINRLHSEIIKCQLDEFFQHIHISEYEYLLEKKRELESQLTEQSNCVDFHWMDSQELISKLPEESVYIDYMQYPSIIRKEQYLGDLQFSIFSVIKSGGQVFINTYKPVNLLFVRVQFMIMSGFVRTKGGREQKREAEKVLGKEKDVYWNLYMLLLKPILERTPTTVKKLFISGDVEINGFPFALFLDENNSYVIDNYKIMYLNSIRNIGQETWIDFNTITDAKVIGNPLFSCIRSNSDRSRNNVLLPLPFSKIEAIIVASVLKTTPILREKAKKSVLDDYQCQLLHIATHGTFFDIDEEEEGQKIVDSLNRSCFYLSGANDWILTQNEYTDCGTGIVTAEEFLIHDYPHMQLIVLSSCFSGAGDISYSQGLLGLRTALLAQGIKNIIISLWEVDDFASAILMKRFYENMERFSISDSLRDAQNYLKKVSIGELKENGWFDEERIKTVGLVAEEMRKFSELPPETMKFELPKYWAGYVLLEQK